MGLKADLESEVSAIFKEKWEVRQGTVVPDTDGLPLRNVGVELDATILYADLAASTELVKDFKAHFAAEVYKTYLHCAAKIVRSCGGEITAYDGDRIMAVYLGDQKNSSAAKTALQIHYAVDKIINPAIRAQYPNTSYQVRQCVGVDTSKILVAKTGIRGANDLVWVGRAANYAAKLCTLRQDSYPSWITGDVYSVLLDWAKTTDGKPMWEKRLWTSMSNIPVYRSNWTWAPS